MDRRSFIRLLAAGLVAPVVEPKIKYFLAPEGGWRQPIVKDIVFQPLTYTLGVHIATKYLDQDPYNFDIAAVKQYYQDQRAASMEKLQDAIRTHKG